MHLCFLLLRTPTPLTDASSAVLSSRRFVIVSLLCRRPLCILCPLGLSYPLLCNRFRALFLVPSGGLTWFIGVYNPPPPKKKKKRR